MVNYPAIIWGTRTIDWQKLEQYLSSVIKHLKGRGIASQDRIVIIEHNSPEYVIILLALWKMGVVACPLNQNWPYETLAQCSQALNPKIILTGHRQFKALKKASVPIVEFKELISYDARQAQEINNNDFPLANEATIIWTSGSSSQPKAAVHTWGNHVYSAKGSQEVIPLTQGDRWALALPLYHVSGISIVCRCFLAQAAVVVVGEDDLVNVLRKTKPTHISLVATQLYRLMEHKHNHELLKSITYILLGGSSIPYSLLQKALSLDLSIYTSYGLTEMASQVATGKVEKLDQPCAEVLPYRQLKIDSDGQICVKGEVLFKGYLNQNKIYPEVDSEGWFKTRDLGKLEDGCLTVLGRMDNMFVCAGENIQPEEIENVLMRSPQVKEVIVISKDDPEYGQRPVAFVRVTGTFDENYLKNYCIPYLSKIKIPITFYAWPQDLSKGLKISRKFFQERVGKL